MRNSLRVRIHFLTFYHQPSRENPASHMHSPLRYLGIYYVDEKHFAVDAKPKTTMAAITGPRSILFRMAPTNTQTTSTWLHCILFMADAGMRNNNWTVPPRRNPQLHMLSLNRALEISFLLPLLARP